MNQDNFIVHLVLLLSSFSAPIQSLCNSQYFQGNSFRGLSLIPRLNISLDGLCPFGVYNSHFPNWRQHLLVLNLNMCFYFTHSLSKGKLVCLSELYALAICRMCIMILAVRDIEHHLNKNSYDDYNFNYNGIFIER